MLFAGMVAVLFSVALGLIIGLIVVGEFHYKAMHGKLTRAWCLLLPGYDEYYNFTNEENVTRLETHAHYPITPYFECQE